MLKDEIIPSVWVNCELIGSLIARVDQRVFFLHVEFFEINGRCINYDYPTLASDKVFAKMCSDDIPLKVQNRKGKLYFSIGAFGILFESHSCEFVH